MNDIISYFITSLDDQGISFRNPDSDLYFLPFPMRGLYFEIIVQGQFVSILFPMVSDGIQWPEMIRGTDTSDFFLNRQGRPGKRTWNCTDKSFEIDLFGGNTVECQYICKISVCMDDVTILADLRQIIDLQQVFMRGRVGGDKRMALRFFCDITIAQTLLYRDDDTCEYGKKPTTDCR